MDDPDAAPADLDRALRFLRMLNRHLGGVRPLLQEMTRQAPAWPSDRAVRLLDVGTGSADIPRAVTGWARSVGRTVHVTAVDAHPITLEIARRHLGNDSDIELVEADARQLTDRFEPGSFDYVHASLFLHHLDDLDAMTVLRMMDRLATRGVFVNDLVRGIVGRVGARIATIGADPMVRHDAVVSVDAGFTRAEMLDLALRVGLTGIRYRRLWGYRFLLASARG